MKTLKKIFVVVAWVLLFNAIPCAGQTYTGRKISLNLSNADVHDVLRIIAETGGVNVIVGDDVKGRVTLKLTNVPWDQALDIVLQSLGLARVTIDP